MKYLPKSFSSIKKRATAGAGVLLLFDFDGTIAPIVGDPLKAEMLPHWRDWLVALMRKNNIEVGVVTGRAQPDAKDRVRIDRMLIASDHGYEIWRGHKKLFSIGSEFTAKMKKLGAAVYKKFGSIPGVSIEQKDYSVALHYRHVDVKKQNWLVKEYMEMIRPILKEQNLELMKAKKLFEVRPKKFWDKGKSSKWIWENIAPRYLPVYFGDDTTDEDAFRELKKVGITIRVGLKKSSNAEYYVRKIDDAAPLVKWLLEEYRR